MTYRKLEIPDELLKEMTLVDSFYPTDEGNPLGLTCYSQEVNGAFYLRIFHLLYDEADADYHIVDELPTIKFKTEEELINFSNYLPQMNGIEMMLFMHNAKILHNDPMSLGKDEDITFN